MGAYSGRRARIDPQKSTSYVEFDKLSSPDSGVWKLKIELRKLNKMQRYPNIII